jgi:hypothetical protein
MCCKGGTGLPPIWEGQMSIDYISLICVLAAVALVAVLGPLVAIGLYAKLDSMNDKIKAMDDLLDTIQEQTDLKKEEKVTALGKQLRKAFPEIADAVDNRGFGLSVYTAHKAYRKAVNYYGTPGSKSWTKKADAKLASLAGAVNDFYGHSVLTRIPGAEWKKRVAVFIKAGA